MVNFNSQHIKEIKTYVSNIFSNDKDKFGNNINLGSIDVYYRPERYKVVNNKILEFPLGYLFINIENIKFNFDIYNNYAKLVYYEFDTLYQPDESKISLLENKLTTIINMQS